jgi:hypothetical protein
MPGIVETTTQPLRKCLAAGLKRDEIERMGGKIIGPNVEIDSNAAGFDRIVKLFKVKFRYVTQPAMEDRMRVVGPILWAEFHRWALTADLASAADWLTKFVWRLPCGQCRKEYRTVLAEMPPVTSSHDELFAWTCAAHNKVNRKLEKPEMSIEDARARWATAP